jgi:hypothetical protein
MAVRSSSVSVSPIRWRLRAESPGIGNGACFVISLPIEAGDAHLAQQPSREGKP